MGGAVFEGASNAGALDILGEVLNAVPGDARLNDPVSSPEGRKRMLRESYAKPETGGQGNSSLGSDHVVDN